MSLVLDGRRGDGEHHAGLTAEFLGHVGFNGHRPRLVGQAHVLEVGRPDSENHVTTGVGCDPWLGVQHAPRDGQPVSGERDRCCAVTADQLWR
jgi:hypothetical protein